MIAAPSRELLEIVCEAVYGHGIADAAISTPHRTRHMPITSTVKQVAWQTTIISAKRIYNPLFRALTQSWTVKALADALMETITEERRRRYPHLCREDDE